MKQTLLVTVLAGLSIALAACGGGKNNGVQQVRPMNPLHAAHNAIAGHSLQINMGEQNHSGQTGNASVVDVKGGANVAIHLKSEPKGASEPAHIHKGTCSKLDPVPWKGLNPVVNGTSMTHLPGVTVAQLKKGQYSINVHKSAADLKTYVSCGGLTP